jgi:hypothetical protein
MGQQGPKVQAAAFTVRRSHVPNRRSAKPGNFEDFDMLFEQLASPAVMTLGFPLPEDKFMPRPRAGSCPAAHNRALLGEED